MTPDLDLHKLREKLEKQLKEEKPAVRISMTNEQAKALLHHVVGKIDDWNDSMSAW
jgi:hypothetical protein